MFWLEPWIWLLTTELSQFYFKIEQNLVFSFTIPFFLKVGFYFNGLKGNLSNSVCLDNVLNSPKGHCYLQSDCFTCRVHLNIQAFSSGFSDILNLNKTKKIEDKVKKTKTKEITSFSQQTLGKSFLHVTHIPAHRMVFQHFQKLSAMTKFCIQYLVKTDIESRF